MAAARIRKWGNSAALRLPTATLEEARLSIDQDVEILVSPGRIVIEASVPTYSLDEMLASVTPTNAPKLEVDSPAVGAEVIEW